MADAEVDKLVHQVVRLVEADTVDGVSRLRPGQRLELDERLEERLKPLARNRDVPGRLAPTAYKFADRKDTRWHDPREDARRGLTALVAACANSLEPDPALPLPVDAAARDRLATAVSRAYAVSATPRLAADVFANGRPDDLGHFAPPQVEGDVAAARAMAIAIGARTGMRESDVLRKLVADGPQGAAYTATDLLLKNRPDYQRLPVEQQPGIRRHLARSIEDGFARRDVRQAAQRELTQELEDRSADVAGGAGTIDAASKLATDEVASLHEFLQRIDYWERSAEPSPEEVRATVVEGLVSRVEHHAGHPTRLTSSQLESPAAVATAAAETMMAATSIPAESRSAAVAATAGMLAEGFDELPALVDSWKAEGSSVQREAEVYGATLGDRALAAARTFERHPPNPDGTTPDRSTITDRITTPDRAEAFAADPAVPPLRKVQAGAQRRADDGPARPRNGGSDGLTR